MELRHQMKLKFCHWGKLPEYIGAYGPLNFTVVYQRPEDKQLKLDDSLRISVVMQNS